MTCFSMTVVSPVQDYRVTFASPCQVKVLFFFKVMWEGSQPSIDLYTSWPLSFPLINIHSATWWPDIEDGFYGSVSFLPTTSFVRLLRHAEDTPISLHPGNNVGNLLINGDQKAQFNLSDKLLVGWMTRLSRDHSEGSFVCLRFR